MTGLFDLNIETFLDQWEVFHAIREIIANALDEQILTGTKDVQIVKEGTIWHIRDYGRGFQYKFLTQNENPEKLNREDVIGKFGVGLKDAMAVLYRHGVTIRIKSKYNVISTTMAPKEGFSDTITLHANVQEPSEPNMVGTDVELTNC